MQVQDGYPIDMVTANYQALCVGWDPDSRLPRTNASDIYPQQGLTTPLGGRSFQFKFGYNVVGFSKGDFVTVSARPWHSVPSISNLSLSFLSVTPVQCCVDRGSVHGVYARMGTKSRGTQRIYIVTWCSVCYLRMSVSACSAAATEGTMEVSPSCRQHL